MPSGLLHMKVGEHGEQLYRHPFLWFQVRIGSPSSAKPSSGPEGVAKWTEFVPAIVDTGADVSVIPKWLLGKLEDECGRKLRSPELVPDRPRRVMTAAGPTQCFSIHVMLELQSPVTPGVGPKHLSVRELNILEALDDKKQALPDERQSKLVLIGMDIINQLGEFHYIRKPTEDKATKAELRWGETGTQKRAAKNDRNLDR